MRIISLNLSIYNTHSLDSQNFQFPPGVETISFLGIKLFLKYKILNLQR